MNAITDRLPSGLTARRVPHWLGRLGVVNGLLACCSSAAAWRRT